MGQRSLFSVEGPVQGWTRQAIVAIPYDHVHVFATDPAADGIEELGQLVEMAGGTFSVEAVPGDDLLGAFETIRDRLTEAAGEEAVCQVNAGKDANLLSAAGLLACLHTGVAAHFLDESGHTEVPVLTQAPLARLLGDGEREALVAFPEAGLHIQEVSDNDPEALNGLRKRGLIELDGDRLRLTATGRSYRAHVQA